MIEPPTPDVTSAGTDPAGTGSAEDAADRARRSRIRRVVTTALAALVVVGGTVGGVGYTYATVAGADRSAPTVLRHEPSEAEKEARADDPAPDVSFGRSDSPLTERLLPAPDLLGPDLPGFDSNDVELGAEDARREGVFGRVSTPVGGRGMSRAILTELGLQGAALRTYESFSGMVAEFRLNRFGDAEAAQEYHDFLVETLEASGGLPSPAPGRAAHTSPEDVALWEHVRCVRMPGDEEIGPEVALCTVPRGELHLLVVAFGGGYGPGDVPLPDYEALGALLNEQLVHLDTEGKQV
ncbi:hypothetical protein [Streptomyces chumphonensis]|uniref:hypothetical protein n=1 Tax=Streptomyces chumphonensis TaxID=1214925 RepID=UPI003D7073E0